MNLFDQTRVSHDAIAEAVGVPADWKPDATAFTVGYEPFVQAWEEARHLRSETARDARQAEAYQHAVTKLESLWDELRDRPPHWR